MALITNTVGSEPVHRQERTPALNADTAGAQKTEYSPLASALGGRLKGDSQQETFGWRVYIPPVVVSPTGGHITG